MRGRDTTKSWRSWKSWAQGRARPELSRILDSCSRRSRMRTFEAVHAAVLLYIETATVWEELPGLDRLMRPISLLPDGELDKLCAWLGIGKANRNRFGPLHRLPQIRAAILARRR